MWNMYHHTQLLCFWYPKNLETSFVSKGTDHLLLCAVDFDKDNDMINDFEGLS